LATGLTYEAPVVLFGPSSLPSGTITGAHDTLSFHYLGGQWNSPATQAPGTTPPARGIVLNDTFFISIGGVTLSMPVTLSVAPGGQPSGEMSLVTIDGVEYVRVTFPDGEVRYEEMHETPTPDATGSGVVPVAATTVFANPTGATALPVFSANPVVASLSVGDVPYDATAWNGDLSVPTKNAIRDALVALPVAGSVATDPIFDAKGDLAVGTGADAAARLATGTNGFVLTADSATATGLKWAAAAAGGVATGDSPTWSAAHIFAVNGAADTPAIRLSGTPFLGTATTSKPLLLIEPTGTTSTGWATTGTMLGVNAATGFAGNLIDLKVIGTTGFKVDSGGTVTTFGNVNVGASVLATSHLILNGTTNLIYWNGGDLVLGRLGPKSLRLGNNPTASPTAQTLTLGEASRPGTDSNVAGANGTLQSGLGTGTGTASSLIFQTPTVAASGSTVQTYATRLTVNTGGATIVGDMSCNGAVVAAANQKFLFSGIGGLYGSAVSGVMSLQDTGATSARIGIGGQTSSHPAIKRNGAALAFRLADDSADCAVSALSFQSAAPAGGTSGVWKLGTVAVVSPTVPNRTIEVEIGGTTYYLAAKTTNN
jgi:hypothetical protein